MSSGGARRGRRDNGLTAAEYAVVADVDPRIGEHLLDVLGLAGIAAYLQPAADLHPVTRTTTLPSTPADRLYVDRTHLETARHHLAELLPPGETGMAPGRRDGGAARTFVEPADDDVDAAWADIIAGYARVADPEARAESIPGERAAQPDQPSPATADRTGDDPAGTGPAGGDSTGAGLGVGGSAPEARRRAAAEPPSLLDGLDTFGADLPDDDDEGYTPPPPPPMPRPSAPAVAGVLGVVGGLILIIWPEVLPADATTTLVFGFVALLAGFVTLVWRLRPGDDGDDPYDPDDGAVV